MLHIELIAIIFYFAAELRSDVPCNLIHGTCYSPALQLGTPLSTSQLLTLLPTPPKPHMGQIVQRTSSTLDPHRTKASELSRSSADGHTARWEATDSIVNCLSSSSNLDPPFSRSPPGVRGQGFPPSSARPVISTWRF